MTTTIDACLDRSMNSTQTSISSETNSICSKDMESYTDCINQFQPSQKDLVGQYQDLEVIYKEILSPSVVTLIQSIDSNQKVIKKEILKEKLFGDNQLPQARRECVIHSILKHKNLVELMNYTEDEEKVTMYMDYANEATQLETQLDQKKKEIKDEQLLKHYVRQILLGIQYIHSKGIVHADIKPANILLHQNDIQNEQLSVQIADFGVSQLMPMGKDGKYSKAFMKELSGTRNYMAPELSKNQTMVGPEIDIWSFGVLLYQMCVAYLPTQVKGYKYTDGSLPYRPRDWRHLTQKGAVVQDLVNKCLDMDPEERLSASEALAHPFLQD